jgi:hypothetical protein
MMKFCFYQLKSSLIKIQMSILLGSLLVFYMIFYKNKWVFMLINGEMEICLFGTIYKQCMHHQEVSKEEGY